MLSAELGITLRHDGLGVEDRGRGLGEAAIDPQDMRGQNVPGSVWRMHLQPCDRAQTGVGVIDPVTADHVLPDLGEAAACQGGFVGTALRHVRHDEHTRIRMPVEQQRPQFQILLKLAVKPVGVREGKLDVLGGRAPPVLEGLLGLAMHPDLLLRVPPELGQPGAPELGH
ncbi:MAG: hypothetical protein CMP48_03175 [Rickettsiales bacterium]|nr:hypothetical protein [Rickettsiales bacterium]